MGQLELLHGGVAVERVGEGDLRAGASVEVGATHCAHGPRSHRTSLATSSSSVQRGVPTLDAVIMPMFAMKDSDSGLCVRVSEASDQLQMRGWRGQSQPR